jgi:hypothetical protein
VALDLPVQTSWDIGVDDAMAIRSFEVYPDRLHIVDYYKSHGRASIIIASIRRDVGLIAGPDRQGSLTNWNYRDIFNSLVPRPGATLLVV